MSRACATCGNTFEKESGYFIGAMIASYFLGVFLAFPALLLMVFRYRLEMADAIGASVLLIFMLQPFLFRYSRIFWIRMEHRLTRALHSTHSIDKPDHS
jgi:hypothetical protein